jgi:hypothetical protein
MFKLEPDPEFGSDLAKQISQQVTEQMSAKYAVAAQWPEMLDYKDISKFFRCSITKANQIMNIADFPRVPGVGLKKVPIWSLINWVEHHSNYMAEMYPKYSEKVI